MSFNEDKFMWMVQHLMAKSIAQESPHDREKIAKQFAASEQEPGGKWMQQASQLYLTHKEELDAMVREEAEAAPLNAETVEPDLGDEELEALIESLSTPEHMAAVLAKNPDLRDGFAELVAGEQKPGSFGDLIKQALEISGSATQENEASNVKPLFGKKEQ